MEGFSYSAFLLWIYGAIGLLVIITIGIIDWYRSRKKRKK